MLSKMAQQGYQLHQVLCQNPLVKELVKDAERNRDKNPKPLQIYAADSSVRAPLELCYTHNQPRSDSAICPDAPKALGAGRCVAGCIGLRKPNDYVCPAAFWSLSRVLEWRSQVADRRADPDALEISNELSGKRRRLDPLRQVLVARSSTVKQAHVRRLQAVFKAKAIHWSEAKSWKQWGTTVEECGPSMLLLMPHVNNEVFPPTMEIQKQTKDPPGVVAADVVGSPGQPPIVLLLGCGAAISFVDFANLPAQFRYSQAALVVAPIAELLAKDAPVIAAAIIETLAKAPPGTRPFGEVLLEAKRSLLVEGKLAAILLLAFGDSDWLV
jgi:hypothetical protein